MVGRALHLPRMIGYLLLAIIGLGSVFYLLTRPPAGKRFPGPSGLPFLGILTQLGESTFIKQFEDVVSWLQGIKLMRNSGVGNMVPFVNSKLLDNEMCSFATGK